MQHHAERIRRIKKLCTRLDAAISESQDLQQHAQALRDEAERLVVELSAPRQSPEAVAAQTPPTHRTARAGRASSVTRRGSR